MLMVVLVLMMRSEPDRRYGRLSYLIDFFDDGLRVATVLQSTGLLHRSRLDVEARKKMKERGYWCNSLNYRVWRAAKSEIICLCWVGVGLDSTVVICDDLVLELIL